MQFHFNLLDILDKSQHISNQFDLHMTVGKRLV
jgi:hypothetical protein